MKNMIGGELLVEVGKKFLIDALSRGMALSVIGLMTLLPTGAFADYVGVNGEEYLSLDYIVATGNQWIVTDIRPTCTDTVKMKFRLSTTGTQALYCSRTTMTNNTFTAFYFENVVRSDRNTSASTKGNTTLTTIDDTVFVADYTTRRFFVNDIEQNVQMTAGEYTPGSVLMLFASHTFSTHAQAENLSPSVASDYVNNRGRYRLYYFELYDSNSEMPKHRLMPAQRRSDSVVGLYDTVAGKFYGHAENSDTFIPSPSIADVTAQQRYPWNGKVDIIYTVIGDIAAEAKQRAVFTSLKVMAIDKLADMTNIATQLSGDTSLTEGTHKLIWDMDAEGLTFKSSNVTFKVACETTPAIYCVIDLAGGANASAYPITYLAEPPGGGFNVDAYKTSKIALRRIEPGSFLMCGQYNVTLTKPFFVGVFEVTQKQYSLVMGTNPSEYTGDKRPVEKVSYDMIRGSSRGAYWPLSPAVDSTSFIGKLQIRTGLNFDLPTEAQWEYACRAGTPSAYNNGGNSETDLKKLGRYTGNTSDGKGGNYSKHTLVGSYTPNTWGLYDMHGNVWEWCLDWYDRDLPGDVINPQGLSLGTYRSYRGGSWSSPTASCASSYRASNASTFAENFLGFRLARTLAE